MHWSLPSPKSIEWHLEVFRIACNEEQRAFSDLRDLSETADKESPISWFKLRKHIVAGEMLRSIKLQISERFGHD